AHVHQVRTFGAPNTPAPQFVPGSAETLKQATYLSTLKLTTVLTDRMVNEARMAFSRVPTIPHVPGVPSAVALGMTPVDPLFDEPPETTIQGSLGGFKFFANSNSESN